MAAIKFLQDIDIDGEIFLGEDSVSRINMTIGSGATENKYKQTLGSNYLQFDLDPDQQQTGSNMQFRIDLDLKMTIGTDVTVSNDLYVNGGKVYMGGNTNPIFDNSANDEVLLIGDTALSDTVQTINLNTFGQNQIQVGDGEVFFFASIESEGNLNIGQSSNINMGNGSNIIFNNDSQLRFATSIPTNNESNGITIYTASTTVSAGGVYALRFSLASPIWTGVDADTDSSTKLLAVATGANATNGMLTMGVVRKSSHGFTVGLPLYIHPTSNAQLSNTAPTGSGQYVRVCGYAIDADHYYFNPDGAWVQIV